MIPQYDTRQTLQLRYGFSRVDRAIGDYRTDGPRATAVSFQSARQMLKADCYGVLYLAWRQGRERSWTLGELRKDKLGRIRFYRGWPGINGLIMIACKDVFVQGAGVAACSRKRERR